MTGGGESSKRMLLPSPKGVDIGCNIIVCKMTSGWGEFGDSPERTLDGWFTSPVAVTAHWGTL